MNRVIYRERTLGGGGDPINLKIGVTTQGIWELLDIGLYGLYIDLSIGI